GWTCVRRCRPCSWPHRRSSGPAPTSRSPRRPTSSTRPARPSTSSSPSNHARLIGRAGRGERLDRCYESRVTEPVEPRVGIAHIEAIAADRPSPTGREAFPDFERYARLGVHIQSDQVRIATPPHDYVETALMALVDACRELGVPHADIAFVDTVVP